MGYWNNEIDGCDYAFDSVGASMSWIKQRMFNELDNVIAKAYPEQSIAASICLLRLMAERFPKQCSVVFGKRDLARARDGFARWYELVEDKLPAERKAAIRAAAEHEFALFEEIFKKNASGV